MNQTKHKTFRLSQILSLGLLFIFGVFYLYRFADYIFFYQEKAILFQVSVDYLKAHLNQPGGFLIWLSKLQTAFYFYPLLGSIFISVQICAIVFVLNKIALKISNRRLNLMPFLLGATLFYLQTNYQYLAFNNLGILIQLCLFLCVISYSKKEFLWLAVVLSPTVYFLFGSFSIIFLLMLALYLLQQKEWLRVGVLVLFCALFFFVGKEYFFFQTRQTLFKYPFSLQDVGAQIQVFFAAVFAIVLLPLWTKINLKWLTEIRLKQIPIVELTPAIVIVLLAFVVMQRIDKKNSQYFQIEKLFYAQQYDELIQFNEQSPSSNMLTAFLNNVALAESGKLSEDFFKFRQSPDGGTLFLKWEIISEVLKRGGYFYYSVGMINEAQRWAYEYMVMNGNSPEALKMMIKTDLIKGKYEIAEKYISILEKSVFYRNEAGNFRALLFDDKAVSSHVELGKKQALDSKQDFFVQAENPPANLDFIIEADSANFMAIEYKLAWLMLQKDMKGVVALLPLMEKAGYKRIPKNVEELIATYKLMRVGEMPELQQLKVSKQTEQRFQQFYKIFQQNKNNKQQAQRALAREFSDTYWYFVFFN